MLKKIFWTYQSAVAGAAIEISKPKSGKHTLEQFRKAVYAIHFYSIPAVILMICGVAYIVERI